MNKKILVMAFFSSFVLTLVGASLKFTHTGLSEEFLILAIAASLFTMVCFIVDVSRSNYVTAGEKWMWITGFVFMGGMAAVLYLIKFRKVIGNS